MATTTLTRPATTVQGVLVDARPVDVYAAIWEADLLRMALARRLSAISLWPEHVRAWVRH